MSVETKRLIALRNSIKEIRQGYRQSCDIDRHVVPSDWNGYCLACGAYRLRRGMYLLVTGDTQLEGDSI